MEIGRMKQTVTAKQYNKQQKKNKLNHDSIPYVPIFCMLMSQHILFYSLKSMKP